jgi:hypothetical protein
MDKLSQTMVVEIVAQSALLNHNIKFRRSCSCLFVLLASLFLKNKKTSEKIETLQKNDPSSTLASHGSCLKRCCACLIENANFIYNI